MPSDVKPGELEIKNSEHNEISGQSSPVEVGSSSASTPERASSIQRYEEEWSQLCGDLDEIRHRALQGDFRASRFRSICWRLLLGLFTPGKPKLWVEEANKARKHYRLLKETLNCHPWNESPQKVRNDNPLSQEAGSTWNQYFCDKELRIVIQQDVTRTFPGVDFFRNVDIQNSMVDTLFCYAREFPRMCYRQGMHEVLAPLLFVTYCDHQAYLHTRECDSLSDVMCEVLNPEFLVEDSYMMFRKIMELAGIAYQTSDILPTATGYFPSRTSGISSSGENQMMGELNWIRDYLLKPADEKLYKHLQELDIPLPLFGIRWLRLLFGREFPLQDLLVLWDAIFAAGTEFELVNYVVVAMLLAIGDQLLSSGYTECMNLLMRYPPTSDISYIIKKALHLKEPALYSDPVMVASQISRSTRSEDSSPPSSPQISSRERPQNFDKRQTSKQVAAITNSIKRLSTRKKKGIASTPPSALSSHEGGAIIDGYTLQDPSLLKTELKQAKELMKFCRVKLLQYHNILIKQIPPDDNASQQALVGIHELCSLMDEHSFTPSTPSPSSVEIEPAYEVGESSRLSLISPLATPVTPTPGHHSFDLPPPKTAVVMKTFKETEGPVIETETSLMLLSSDSTPSSSASC
ncbi:TBC1 domain family member 5 [Lycorma delicatula]|uniref:TBC1 domain family member 5 n=1 Tax=Lycorma delicatula TaxID=130591 RepID=UPI003F510838